MVENLRQNPRCDFECCLLVTLMMNGASADLSGMEPADMFSQEVVKTECTEAPGISSSVEDIGLMEMKLEESENEGNSVAANQQERGQKYEVVIAVENAERASKDQS